MIYAGIGARSTPDEILELMQRAAKGLSNLGYTLRSGGAKGADSAFEAGVSDPNLKEIFLPFQRFNGNESPRFGTCRSARLIAKEFHPNWPNLGCRGRDFMARNAYQILGQNLKRPADFVLCWTPNGKVVGGTGQALRMAAHFQIPVFNFAVMAPNEINDEIYRLGDL
jgi:hypothetical protein